MTGRCKTLLGCVAGLLLFSAALSWLLIYGLDTLAPVPLGLCPVLVFALGESTPGLIAGILLALAVYAWMAAGVVGVARRKRFGTASVLVLLTLDIAGHVVFTIAGWQHLLAVALDLLILFLCYRLYRVAGEG